jgi:hypothetical protein
MMKAIGENVIIDEIHNDYDGWEGKILEISDTNQVKLLMEDGEFGSFPMSSLVYFDDAAEVFNRISREWELSLRAKGRRK